MTNETAILDLPPEPSAYVELCQDYSGPRIEALIPVLKHDDGQHGPPEPPHDHVEEPPPTPEPTPWGWLPNDSTSDVVMRAHPSRFGLYYHTAPISPAVFYPVALSEYERAAASAVASARRDEVTR